MRKNYRFALVCLAIVLLAGGLGGDSRAEEADTPKVQRIDQALARSVVDRIVLDVERLRGLEFKSEVPVAVVDDDQAMAQHMRRLEEFGELEDIASAEIVLKVLGLARQDDDILALFTDALREQVGGYYDPKEEKFYLLDDMPAALVDILTAHELTHALEDQYFKLDASLQSDEATDDEIFARGSVTEGSATLVMTIYSMQMTFGQQLTEEDLSSMAAVGEEAIQRLPKVLLRQMMAPYVVGMSFVQRGNAAGWMATGFPIADVNRVYEDPPRSSEQILHPEKYWDDEQRDDPIPVDLGEAGAALGSGWTRAADGVLGEINVAVMVGAGTPEPADPGSVLGAAWTNEAAEGWGGDRYELWTRGKKSVVLLSTVWDTETDARQFLAGLGDSTPSASRREGRNVALVYGDAPRKRVKALLAGMLREIPAP